MSYRHFVALLALASLAAHAGPLTMSRSGRSTLAAEQGGGPGGDSALEQLIASMDVGDWEELAGMGGDWDGGAIFNSGVGGYDAEYGADWIWDPNHRAFWFLGAGHVQEPPGFNYTHLTKFDIDTNDWTLLCGTGGSAGAGDCPPNGVPGGWGHTYSHLALNTNNQRMYARLFGTQTVMVWNTDTEDWESNVEYAPTITPEQCCGAMDYFPELDSVIFVDGDWGVWRMDFDGPSDTTPSNTQIAHGNGGSGGGLTECDMAPYNLGAEYHPDLQVVIVGGGGVCRVNSDGTVTLMNDEPGDVYIGSHTGAGGVGAKVVARSGTDLFDVYADIGSNTEEQWTYDASTDTWNEVAITADFLLNNGVDGPIHGLIGTNIPEMCAQIFVRRDGNSPGTATVLVHKYAETC